MGNKKNKNLRDFAIDLHEQQVINDEEMGQYFGGVSNRESSQVNRGCGGIVPQ